MKSVLIIGGARFHGFFIAKYLAEKNYEVYVLNRGNTRNIYPFNIKQIIADRNNEAELKKALEKFSFDYVIDNNCYNKTQVELLLNALKNKFEHYIFTSTIASYLNFFSKHPLKEEDANGIKKGFIPPDIEDYGKNKFLAEEKIKEYDINYTILRLPNIFGEGDFAFKLAYFNERIKDGRKILLEKEVLKFSIIYSQDIPDIYYQVLGNIKCFKKTFNVAEPVIYDYDLFFSSIFKNYSKENILLIPAEKIHELGIKKSFYLGPAVDASSINKILKIKYTPINLWGEKSLFWELKNISDEKKEEYKNKREEELEIIKNLS